MICGRLFPPNEIEAATSMTKSKWVSAEQQSCRSIQDRNSDKQELERQIGDLENKKKELLASRAAAEEAASPLNKLYGTA